ncbi:MAG: hypothetical protein MMC33_001835 [Icmadophila ericetorum]|nr:hypothetical protein [Icmadophila ericetorum]
MSGAMATSVADQIEKLESARQLVLTDFHHYAAIVPGILPIIGANSKLEIRRWGAEFLAETFASPVLPPQSKGSISIGTLQTLKELIETPGEDATVVKHVIQAVASIYGLVFRHIVNNPNDSPTWERMTAIKSNILKRWDTAPTGIRLCCIKFVQKVVQVQTPGIIADPRRPEQNEISLALVPRDHPLIPPPNLEAEASGLLDRLLNVFHEEPRQVVDIVDFSINPPDDCISDAVLVSGTLNCLGVLVKTRPAIANKILSTVLSSNPFKHASSSMPPRVKVQVRSMDRTTRAFLMHYARSNPNSVFATRIKQYVARLDQSRIEVFDEGSRKRAAPTEGAYGVDNAKRARLTAGSLTIPPLPPGPVSFAQLFTLTSQAEFKAFDVTMLPSELVANIALMALKRIDQSLLDEASTAIRSRHENLGKQPNPNQLPLTALDDEDEYEPFEPVEDSEQVSNREAALQSTDDTEIPVDLVFGSGAFQFPPPPALSQEEALECGKATIDRLFRMLDRLDEPTKVQKPGLHRLAGSNLDKEAWLTIITRIATRASAGLEDDSVHIKDEDGLNGITSKASNHQLSNYIRESLWKFIVEDFRPRIGYATSWLSEEWYNDEIQRRASQKVAEQSGEEIVIPQNYEKWVLKVLDSIVHFLDAKDKVLIRFLSEIPTVSTAVLERVKGLARDPERVTLAVNALHYLILMKPPAREIAIDALEDLWRNYDDLKPSAAKLLTKWRPQVILEENKPTTSVNGVSQDQQTLPQEVKAS